MNKLIIIGAGGHGRVIADSAIKNGYFNICFVDDNLTGECLGFPIVGTINDLEKLNDGKTDFIIGIGNNSVRKRIAEKYDVHWTSIIHPSAQIAIDVSVGRGTAVMAGAVINTGAQIGNQCIINTGAIIEHDNIIEDFVHVSPGVKLSGGVVIGKSSWIGTGSSIKNNISICENVIVGVGSVVVGNIQTQGTYYGAITNNI